MGTDINTDSGVLVPLKQFLKALTIGPEDLDRMIRCLRVALKENGDLAEDLPGLKVHDDMPPSEFLKCLYRSIKRGLSRQDPDGDLCESESVGGWLDYVLRGRAAWGVIDRTGTWLVEPTLQKIEILCNGLAAAQDEEDGPWGFVDPTGAWVIPAQFECVSSFFAEDLAWVQQNECWGAIDKTGNWVIPPQFELVGRFCEGVSGASQDALWGFLDKSGAWVISPQFEETRDFHGELAVVSKNGLWGLIDKLGTWVIEPRFEQVGSFVDGVAHAQQNGVYGFIKGTGAWEIQPQFEDAESFHDGVAKVRKNGSVGFIDKTGRWVIEPRFQEARQFFEGLAPAQMDERWGYIDRTGAWVIRPRFPDCQHGTDMGFRNGIAVAGSDNGLYGLIDRLGDWKLSPTFQYIGPFAAGSAVARQADLYGLIDESGEWALPPQFDKIAPELDPLGVSPITKNWIPVEYRRAILRRCPQITAVIASQGARLTDLWSVKADQPYVVFSEDDCFVTELSTKGQALADLLGTDSLATSTWASISY